MRSHIFCVSSPIAGYAISVFHVAEAIANSERYVHVLLPSKIQSEQWVQYSGRPLSSNVTIDVLADGRWGSWEAPSLEDSSQLLGSEEFAIAVERMIMRVEQVFKGEKCAALLFSGTMSRLWKVAVRRGLRPYLVMPTPHYYTRLGGCHIEGEPLSTRYSLQGLGGSGTPFEVELGDVADLTTPQYYHNLKPAMDSCAGIIFSNSNLGIEGQEFDQPHLPAPDHAPTPTYMLGPCAPQWFQEAVEDPLARFRHIQASETRNECLEFLDSQEEQSVVYISFGSYIEPQQWQIQTLIEGLRKHGFRWILVYRGGSASMKELIVEGESGDGIVSAWAPQLEILTHPAIKCVVTHGGFSTMTEGILAGQCFIVCPFDADQFLNAKTMAHLGISLGTIAESTGPETSSATNDAVFWSEADTEGVHLLFDYAFGTKQGEGRIRQAKVASHALRRRIKEAKQRYGALQTNALCKDMVAGKAEGTQRLFPSFVLGPW